MAQLIQLTQLVVQLWQLRPWGAVGGQLAQLIQLTQLVQLWQLRPWGAVRGQLAQLIQLTQLVRLWQLRQVRPWGGRWHS